MIKYFKKLLFASLSLIFIIPLGCMEVQQQLNPINQELLDAAKNGDVKTVEAALVAGADVNYVDNNGDTALIWAALRNHIAIVTVLLDAGAGAHVNHIDRIGNTALMYAAQNGNIPMAGLLLEHGADVNVNHDYINRWTALDWAITDNKPESAIFFIEHGAKLSHDPESIHSLRRFLNNIIANAFIVEAIFGNIYLVSQLLEQEPGELTHATDKTGKTALHWAAARGNDALVQLLLDHDADIDARDTNGNTPLHLAARNGNLSMVKLLIARGANATIVNRDGQTPLALAYRYHRPTIVALLEREPGRAVFRKLTRAGQAGVFEWQHPEGAILPPEIADIVAQFALAPGHIPPAGSPS